MSHTPVYDDTNLGEGYSSPTNPMIDPLPESVEIKSAMRESNSPVQLGRLVPLPLGQWHMVFVEQEHSATPVGGLEPPIIRLTGGRLTVWPHRKSHDGRI